MGYFTCGVLGRTTYTAVMITHHHLYMAMVVLVIELRHHFFRPVLVEDDDIGLIVGSKQIAVTRLNWGICILAGVHISCCQVDFHAAIYRNGHTQQLIDITAAIGQKCIHVCVQRNRLLQSRVRRHRVSGIVRHGKALAAGSGEIGSGRDLAQRDIDRIQFHCVFYQRMFGLMGFMMLIGISVNNGIYLVDGTTQLRQTMPLEQALIEAGTTRLRPILMTTLTTIISMVPMIFTTSPNLVMMKEMSYIVIGGLIASTALAMFLVPPFYLLMRGERVDGTKRPSRFRRKNAEAESATVK